MSGWPLRRLGDVCKFKPPKREARAALSDGALVSFVPMNDLRTGQKYLVALDERPLSDVVGAYTYFADGDVLLAKITPCFENGKLGVARGLTNGIGFGSTEYIVIRPGPEVVAEYLYHFLDQNEVRERGAKAMTGAVGHKRVPQEFVEALEIPLPPVEEQWRIVAVLDEAFAEIATAAANAEKNIANARDLLNSELDALIESARSTFPGRPLADYCRRVTVGHVGPMKGRYQEEGIPFLRSQNVRPFQIELDGVTYIDEVFDAELEKSRLSPGDVAVVRTGYPGTAAVIPPSLPNANCADLVIVRPSADLNPHYLAAFLNSNLGKRMIAGNLVGAAQKHFNVGAAKKVPIPLPPVPEQEKFVARVDELRDASDRLAEIYELKLGELVALKQSVLHRAFAGELTGREPIAA